MYRIILTIFVTITFQLKGQDGIAKNLSVHYEELTAPDFVTAVEKSNGVCIIPMGIMEKHGAHLPLGTDMINIREVVARAAMQEYVVVFPPYYFGQINEARQQPGTLAYSPQLTWDILQETCDELARNGFSKIILVNGHGGNNDFLHYFIFSQNASPKSYALYLYEPSLSEEVTEKVEKMLQSELEDMHAGEKETSEMLAIRPDLVKLTRAQEQSGEDMARLSNLSSFFTAQWWYARFPNHYAGDAAPANAELGNFLVDEKVRHLAEAIKEVKADTSLRKLQEQYYRESLHPLNTKQ
jgi:creatinine amidohydrolase